MTNECVNALKKMNEHYAQNRFDTITADGSDKTAVISHRDLEVISYRTPPGCLYSNAEPLKIVKLKTKQIKVTGQNNTTKNKTKTNIHLENDDGLIIELDSSKMIDFLPAYALTCHKAQGASFDRPFTIYEH